MSEATILLGPIALRDFEVPETITFGGRQALAVHRLIGGTRVVDMLGRDDADITFSGTFLGPDASSRARSIDELRVLGKPIELIWDIFFYTVVVQSFDADFRNPWWVPFRLSCTVVRDEAAPLPAASATLADLLAADLAIAQDLAAQAGIDLSPQQTALAAANAAVSGTNAFLVCQSAFADGLSRLRTFRDAEGLVLDSIAAQSGEAASALLAGLDAAGSASGNLAVATAADAYLGRADAMLAQAST